MKITFVILGAAFVLIIGVMFSLIRTGGALKPAGVIKPAEIGADPAFIGKQIAIRLYPEFRGVKHVIWRLENGDERLAEVVRTTLAHYQTPTKPPLNDLRVNSADNCVENCWYILSLEGELPESLAQYTKTEQVTEIYVQYFTRDEKVPELCEAEKILTLACLKPVSVREVRRKIKTEAPHYFMQRYLKSQFYLFIEKP